MTETRTTPGVYQAISAIIQALGAEGISKDKRNKEQGYTFRGIDDVLNALNPLLRSNNLIIIPRYTDRAVDPRPTKSGGVMYNVSIIGQFEFISTVDGTKGIVGPFIGEAQDSADKATNKAMSAAYKAMAFQTFCIPTEGMEDADATTPEPTVQEPAPPPRRPDPPAAQKKIADGIMADFEKTGDADELWRHPNTQKYLKAWHGEKHNLYELVVAAAKTAKQRIKDEAEKGPGDGIPFNDDIPF